MFDETITHSNRRGFLTRTAAGAAMAALASLPTWVVSEKIRKNHGICTHFSRTNPEYLNSIIKRNMDKIHFVTPGLLWEGKGEVRCIEQQRIRLE